MASRPLPRRPEDVTPAWLTEALRASGSLAEASVEDFVPYPVGTGQMADSVRFALSYDMEELPAPASVVGKFAAADETSRATGVALRSYEIEVCFYQQLARTVGIRTPRCHLAEVDTATGWFTLLLEDLAPAAQGDQLAGCSVDQAALAMEELAKLHAPRWGDEALGRLDWLHRSTPEGLAGTASLLAMLLPGFVERYRHDLDPSHLALAERFVPGIGAYLAGRPGPFAVVHGDYRLDNMLFATEDGGYPLAVVDWQTATYGPPVGDASYFLGAGLSQADRRAHERDLLRCYHEALLALGVEGFSFDRCWSDYRRFAFGGLLMAVAASMLVERTERGDAMFLAMASRHGAQVLDLEAEELLASS